MKKTNILFFLNKQLRRGGIPPHRWQTHKMQYKQKNETFLRGMWAHEEKTSGLTLSAWVAEIAEFCGVGVSAVWAWYSGERTPSATARKLLRLRNMLPDELKKLVPSL